MKGFNLRVKEFREAIVKDINEAGLPVSVATMVISEALHSLKISELNAIAIEQKAYDKDIAEKGSGEDEEICKG